MTANYRSLEQQLSSDLGLTRRPIAIAFRDAPPTGVPKFVGSVPSGCSFWRLASEGRTFFTVPSDHYNCPIGSHTHNIPLPAERAKELEDTLGFMAGIGYVRMEEVMALPAAMAHGLAMSTGCVGNRVYTGVDEGELYAAVPGNALGKLAEAGRTISSANAKLQDYHEARRQQLTTVLT